jgi:hypothetical protein
MAIRCSEQCHTAEPDPEWLNDMSKPANGQGVKPLRESIPTPPAKASEGSAAGLGEGFKLQPAATSDAANGNGGSAKPELCEGFKLEPHAPQSDHPSDDLKPEIKGLEPSAEKTAPSAGTGDRATPQAPQGKSPATARFEPEPYTPEPTPATPPSLLPAS